MSRRRPVIPVLSIIAIGSIVVGTAYALWPRYSYHSAMRPVYAVIKAGEQGWGNDGSNMLHQIMARSSDHHALADHLLSESNGSLAAEGMVLAVQSGHPRARAILQEHLADKRWNWGLANNDDLAKELLAYLDKQPTQQWILNWLAETEKATSASN